MSDAKQELMDAINKYVRATDGESAILTGAALTIRWADLEAPAGSDENYVCIANDGTTTSDALGLYHVGVLTMTEHISGGKAR